MSTSMKRLFLYRMLVPMLALFCAACSVTQTKGGADNEAARQTWERFTARAKAAEINTGPFRVSGTLRYTGHDGQSTRVSSILWGNGSLDSPYPLRLDLLAGVGNVVAKIREDRSSFLAYVPDENTAYTHERGLNTLVSFGVPIPLTLSDLTLLLTGRSGALFLPYTESGMSPMPETYTRTEKGFSYVIRDAMLPGRLEISTSGAPVSWSEYRDNGWTITFESRDDNPLLLRRLQVSHPKGYSALIVVREFERLPKAFPPEHLSLALPRDVDMRDLEN